MSRVPLSVIRTLGSKYQFGEIDMPFREENAPFRRVKVFVRNTNTVACSVMSFPLEDDDSVSSVLYEYYLDKLASEVSE